MSAIMTSTLFLGASGMLITLWDKDATKLSFVLLTLFYCMSAWCGYKTWRRSVFIDSIKTEHYLVEKVDHLIEVYQ